MKIWSLGKLVAVIAYTMIIWVEIDKYISTDVDVEPRGV